MLLEPLSNGMRTRQPDYLIVSPVRDEERFIEHTLRSITRQTVKPLVWVIVDDGSIDGTRQIVERYQLTYPFIHLIEGSKRERREPGSGVIRAFNIGYESVRAIDHQFLVKLDCDLSFDCDYFERLLAKFAENPKLGIASGIYQEARAGQDWVTVEMPPYHAAGASKMIRRQCFEEIGGFVAARGWDSVDEIRAMTRGWCTRHFPELRIKHWKTEGSGIGLVRTSVMHGEIYYLTGGSKFFFLLKVMHRLFNRPLLLGGLGLVWGYLRTMCQKGRPLLVTEDEARCYKSLLNSRILNRVRKLGSFSI